MKSCLPVFLLAMLLTGCGIFTPADNSAPLPVTITPIRLPSTTPTATALPTNTPPPPTPTSTPLPTSTPEPSATPVPTETETPEPLLQAQLGSPRFLPAFLHSDAGCAWRGVAGQVFTEDGQGMAQAVILVSGDVLGEAAEFIALSAAESDYGPGGYEVAFTGMTSVENLSLTIQVYDLQGSPLSAPFSFQMPAGCDQNLALVSFQPAGIGEK